MPTPVRAMHYDQPLTDMSVAYLQDQDAFVANQAFPEVPVDKQSDLYFSWDKDDFLRDEAQERAPNTEAALTDATPSTDPFHCKEYALARDLPWQRIDNADTALNYEQNAVKQLIQKLLIRRDALWSTKYFKTSVWGTDLTGVASSVSTNQFLKWSAAGSTPIEDIDMAKTNVQRETGHTPNTLVITPAIFTALKNHPDVMDRIKYTQTGIVTTALLASLFDLERVIVASGIVNTSKKGASTQTRRFILDDGALLCYAAPAPGIEVASAGYTFTWRNARVGAGEGGVGVRKYSIDTHKADRVEAEMTFDQKVIGADLGVFMTAIL